MRSGSDRNRDWERLRRLSLGIVALVCLAYAVRPDERLPLTPFVEDGFYSLSIARNIGEGRGISYDGSRPTNGFQPVSTFLQAGLYQLSEPADPYSFLRWVIAFQLLLFVLAAWLAGELTRRLAPAESASAAACTGAALLGFSYPVFRHFGNGLETGLYVVGLQLFFWLLLARPRHAWRLRDAAGVGAVLGLLVLVRIDAVFLVTAMTATVFLDGRSAPWPRRTSQAVAIGACAVLVSLPWWLRNLLLFDSVMPTSGQVQALDPAPITNLRRLPAALGQLLFPVLPPFGIRRNPLVTLPMLAVLVLCWSWVLHRGGRRIRETTAGSEPIFAIFAALLVLYYVFAFSAGHFLERYLIPLTALALPPMAAALTTTLAGLPPLARRGALAAGALVFCTVLAEHAATWLAVPALRGNPMFTQQTLGLGLEIPEGRVVAASQSGTLGYFRRGVINLDGKVDPDAARARIEGRAWQYVLERGVESYVDWPHPSRTVLGPLIESGCFVRTDTSGKFEHWERRKPVAECREAVTRPRAEAGP